VWTPATSDETAETASRSSRPGKEPIL
jgi:hypothetical protein